MFSRFRLFIEQSTPLTGSSFSFARRLSIACFRQLVELIDPAVRLSRQQSSILRRVERHRVDAVLGRARPVSASTHADNVSQQRLVPKLQDSVREEDNKDVD